MTHDIDLVVRIPSEAIDSLLAAFPLPDYLLQEASVRDAICRKSMVNLLSLKDGEKVDFWIFADDPFDQSRFSRRQVVSVGNVTFSVSSPEDTILYKLHWSNLYGGSEKQFKDALRVYEVQGMALDHDYLDEWALKLHVEKLWRRLKASAKLI